MKARKKIIAEIEADKLARKKQLENTKLSAPVIPSTAFDSSSQPPCPKKSYTETRIQVMFDSLLLSLFIYKSVFLSISKIFIYSVAL